MSQEKHPEATGVSDERLVDNPDQAFAMATAEELIRNRSNIREELYKIAKKHVDNMTEEDRADLIARYYHDDRTLDEVPLHENVQSEIYNEVNNNPYAHADRELPVRSEFAKRIGRLFHNLAPNTPVARQWVENNWQEKKARLARELMEEARASLFMRYSYNTASLADIKEGSELNMQVVNEEAERAGKIWERRQQIDVILEEVKDLHPRTAQSKDLKAYILETYSAIDSPTEEEMRKVEIYLRSLKQMINSAK